MKLAGKHPGGRPRSFDRDAVLDTAMRLFWRHGYEGVSFQQLTTELRLAAPSLYAAFGNKASLYREALDRYAEMRGASDLSFMDERLTLVEALRRLLEGTAKGLLDPAGELGCMLNTGLIASHPDHADLARELAERRAAFRRLLAQKLCCWVDGERAENLARYLTTLMQGMAIQARDGATADELQAVINEALRASRS
ncbi:MAG: helix-turn-helix domain-containing protein [Rhizomicrobium sp.]